MAPSSLGRWLREPLLHFAVLGLLIALIDVITGAGRDGERVIRIDDEVRGELAALFEEYQDREPTEAEMDVLVARWLDNEIMYREARLLRLDEGDEMFRERLVLKFRNMIGQRLYVPEPSEEELRAYFKQHADEFTQPRTWDFAQFYVAGPDKRQLAEDLAATLAVDEVPEEYAYTLRRYQQRSYENIQTMFGEDVAEQLLDSDGERWVVIESPRGWHLARIEAVYEAVPAQFDELRSILRDKWQAEVQQERLSEAFDEVRNKYTVLRTASS